MPLPQLTPEEQELVDSVRLGNPPATSAFYAWTYFVVVMAIAGWALARNDVQLMGATLFYVVLHRLYEKYLSRKENPDWLSVIEKYEAVIQEVDYDEEEEEPSDSGEIY